MFKGSASRKTKLFRPAGHGTIRNVPRGNLWLRKRSAKEDFQVNRFVEFRRRRVKSVRKLSYYLTSEMSTSRYISGAKLTT